MNCCISLCVPKISKYLQGIRWVSHVGCQEAAMDHTTQMCSTMWLYQIQELTIICYPITDVTNYFYEMEKLTADKKNDE